MYWLIQKLCYGIRPLALSAVVERLWRICRETTEFSQTAGSIAHYTTAKTGVQFYAPFGVFFEQYRKALPFMFIVAGLILLFSWSVRRNASSRKEYL
jgi:hypothetical protein